MKTKTLLLFVVLSLLLLACHKNDDEPERTNPHTVIFFFPYSSDMTSFFKRNINDIEAAAQNGAFANERLVVCISSTKERADIIELHDNKRDTLFHYDNPDFTRSAALSQMFTDIITAVPAEKYSLVAGGHGTAWVPADVKTLSKSFGGFYTKTGIEIIAEAIQNAGLKMQYILFDGCFMSNVEAVYALRNAADYIIGCPTEIMIKGIPYQSCARFLSGVAPDYDGFCRAFCDYYETYDTPCGTIAVTCSSELEALAEVMREINKLHPFDASILNDVQRLDGYKTPVFYDLGDYVAHLCKDEGLLASFNAQLSKTVPYKAHTEYFFSEQSGKIKINAYSGLSVSPPTEGNLKLGVEETEWWKATR
ncbi:MAG: hypothetical protein J6T60_15745 [Bacteroidales bacterium]|nr:hypothetical protein [Bacteroidales bacterium]